MFVLTMVQIKSHKDLVHFETAYVVKLHRVARLANTQPVSVFIWIYIYLFVYL